MDKSSPSFSDVARSYGPALYARALAFTGQSQDAWDLVQDTLERGMRAFPELRSDKVGPWLFVILKNAFLDGWRTAYRRRVRLGLDGIAIESIPCPEPDHEEEPPWASVSD